MVSELGLYVSCFVVSRVKFPVERWRCEGLVQKINSLYAEVLPVQQAISFAMQQNDWCEKVFI